MKLVDTNLLLYVVDEYAEQHDAAKRWIEDTLSSGEQVLFPWIVLVGFLRLSTGRSFLSNPLTVEQSCGLIDDWLEAEASLVPVPSRGHLDSMRDLLSATAVGGNLVNDAHIAALALQYDATVVSFDNDFARFPGVKWLKPE